MDLKKNFTKKGRIQFDLWAEGSKSESSKPFLLDETGEKTRLFHEGDNPFSNDKLIKYDGKYCYVNGEYDERKKKVLVSKIYEIEETVIQKTDVKNKTELEIIKIIRLAEEARDGNRVNENLDEILEYLKEFMPDGERYE